MRRLLLIGSLACLVVLTVAAIRPFGSFGVSGQGILSVRPYDSNGDGVPDGNPTNPSVGDIWRNGVPGCNRLMFNDANGIQCFGSIPCPSECY